MWLNVKVWEVCKLKTSSAAAIPRLKASARMKEKPQGNSLLVRQQTGPCPTQGWMCGITLPNLHDHDTYDTTHQHTGCVKKKALSLPQACREAPADVAPHITVFPSNEVIFMMMIT